MDNGPLAWPMLARRPRPSRFGFLGWVLMMYADSSGVDASTDLTVLRAMLNASVEGCTGEGELT